MSRDTNFTSPASAYENQNSLDLKDHRTDQLFFHF